MNQNRSGRAFGRAAKRVEVGVCVTAVRSFGRRSVVCHLEGRVEELDVERTRAQFRREAVAAAPGRRRRRALDMAGRVEHGRVDLQMINNISGAESEFII